MGVTVVTSAGNINVTTARDVLSAAPSGWDEQVAEYGRGYTFGEPGALIVYRAGDDASIELTILGAARSSDALKMHNQINPNDFTKVLNTNSFGNLDLWTDDSGGQTYANDYIINHITGLGYIGTSKVGSGSWDANIDAALVAGDAGLTGFFMASLKQVLSIIDFSVINPRMLYGGQPSMFSIGFDNFHVSTTGLIATDRVYFLNLFNTALKDAAKISNYSYLICRKHF